MLRFTCSKISPKLWISAHFLQRWPCRDVSSGQRWEGGRITHKGSMNVINMKIQEMGWPPRKSWDGWVDLELSEIHIWAEPAYSQALLCSCCWGKEEEGEKLLSPLYRENVRLCCFWRGESPLHQFNEWLGKQAPEPWLLAAEDYSYFSSHWSWSSCCENSNKTWIASAWPWLLSDLPWAERCSATKMMQQAQRET